MRGEPSRLAALALLVWLAPGCGGGHPTPPPLADGSTPPPTPASLAGVEATVGTRLALLPLKALPRPLRRSCAALPSSREEGERQVAVRISRLGSSLSLVSASGRLAYACDGLGDPFSRRWCGAEVGKLAGGRLLDPRLDLCRGREEAVAFAWVQPLPRARWIVVSDGGLADVYETGDGIPARVAIGRSIDLATASARFRIGQYDGAGRRLVQDELEAFVSG